MRNIVESLSLVSGAVLIAILSTGIVWLLSFVLPAGLRWLSVVLVPFILSYCIYWSPAWLGADPVEYHVWAGLFIFLWFLSGVFPSAVVVFLLRHRAGS